MNTVSIIFTGLFLMIAVIVIAALCAGVRVEVPPRSGSIVVQVGKKRSDGNRAV